MSEGRKTGGYPGGPCRKKEKEYDLCPGRAGNVVRIGLRSTCWAGTGTSRNHGGEETAWEDLGEGTFGTQVGHATAAPREASSCCRPITTIGRHGRVNKHRMKTAREQVRIRNRCSAPSLPELPE